MPHLKITEVALVVLSTMVISKIQQSYIHLFLINHLVDHQIFHSRILYFEKHLTQNFHILKYGLLIKILNLRDRR